MDTDALWRRLDVRRWGRRRVGVAAICVVYAVLGTFNALVVPPFMPRDETGHVAYVVSVARGRLPTIETPLPKDDVPQLRSNTKDTTWVANHPPLFYVLAAGPMKIALALDRPTLGIRLIRLMNVGFIVATMALAAVLARRLLRGSARAPMVAAAATGLVPTVPHVSALAYNDAVAMFTAAAVMVAGLAVHDRGPSGRRLAWVAGCASAAALTRFTNLAVIAPAGVLVAAGVWRHRPGRSIERLAAVFRAGVVVAVPVALTSGWFYLRNWQLYGDITGARALFEMFGRQPSGSTLEYLGSTRFWQSIAGDLVARYAGASRLVYGHGLPLQLGAALLLVLVVGLLCAAGRALRTGRADQSDRRVPPDLLVAAVAVGALGLFAVMIAQFQSGGGSPHSRYLFPVLPVVGCLVALALAALPGNPRGMLSVGALLAAVTAVVELLHRFLSLQVDDRGWGRTEIHAIGQAVPAPTVVLVGLAAVLLAAAGVAIRVLLTLPDEQLLRSASAGSPFAQRQEGHR